MSMDTERRHKWFSISDGTAYDIILGRINVKVVATPVFPEDVKLEAVKHDFERQAFVFLVSHPSFDVVPEGMMAPMALPLFTRIEKEPEEHECPFALEIHNKSVMCTCDPAATRECARDI